MFLFGGTVSILNDNICFFKPLVDVPINFINFKSDISPAVNFDICFFHGLERIVQGRQGFVFHLYQGKGFVKYLLIIGRYCQYRVADKPDHIVAQEHLFFLFFGPQRKPVFNYLGNLENSGKGSDTG